MELLPTIYWSMAIGGTLITLILLLLGGGHDFGHGGLEAGHVIDLHGHVDAGHSAEGHQSEGPGYISLRTILGFIGGWGWGGLIGYDMLKWGIFSAPFGAAVGLLIAIIVFRFSRFLYNQEATSTISTMHLIGQEGVVLTTIPQNGVGEIRIYARGVPLKALARAEGSEPLAEGCRVIVTEELGGTLVVRHVTS
ncbi:MAG: NfeD family protein [Armatimonadia bacterium]